MRLAVRRSAYLDHKEDLNIVHVLVWLGVACLLTLVISNDVEAKLLQSVLKHEGRDNIIPWIQSLASISSSHKAIAGMFTAGDPRVSFSILESGRWPDDFDEEIKNTSDAGYSLVGIAGYLDWVETYKDKYSSEDAVEQLKRCEHACQSRNFYVPAAIKRLASAKH